MRIYFYRKFLLAFFLFLCFACFSQEDLSKNILLKGAVYDAAFYFPLPYSMIVNKTTSSGFFAGMQGEFTVSVLKTDTIIISARGYHTKKLCFKDSVEKAIYEVDIMMQKLSFELPEIEIKPERKIEEIEKEILQMKEFSKHDYVLSGINAVRSPITYFYQSYSRREKSRRKVAELEIEDAKRELIKELLRMYVKGNIIQLEEKEFDKFIDYCNVNIEFLKNSTQYEFIMFIKKKHEDYLRLPRK